MKNTFNIIILIISLLVLNCEKNSNPVLSHGETCEGPNGAISSSGRWQEFNTSNSCLPDNTIRCLEVDHNNNLWVGTDNGLVFYDGIKWIIYNTNNSGLPSNVILSLASDSDTIWVGMGGALVKFDGRSWIVYDSSNSPLGNTFHSEEIGFTILTLKVDSKHNIWAGTNYYGLYKFDNTNWTVYYPTYETPISSSSISTIDIDAQDIVWIGHFEPAGIDKFDGKNWVNYTPDNSPLPDLYINDIQIDKVNVKWFATSFGLARFDDTSWDVYETTNSAIEYEILFSIAPDSKNNLWIGTFSGALLTQNNSGWSTFYINDATEPAKPYNTINCVKVDHDDNKWLGTYSGVYKFNEEGI